MANTSLNIINSYIDHLKIFGYINNKEVMNILYCLFILEMMSGEFSEYITEEDKQLFYNEIDRLTYDSCFIRSEYNNCKNITNNTLCCIPHTDSEHSLGFLSGDFNNDFSNDFLLGNYVIW